MKTEQLVLRLPTDLNRRLAAEKKRTGNSYNVITIAALEATLKPRARRAPEIKPAAAPEVK
jgi:hypothetical protein